MDHIARINASDGSSLELGCGARRARPGYITVDLADYDTVDIRQDVMEVLAAITDDKIDGVFASHFIEHVDDLNAFLKEIVRVCRPGALIEFIAPHFSNPWFYSDPTHNTFFGLYTFSYLAEEKIGFTRKVPPYARIPSLVIRDIKLGFGTLRGWKIRFYSRKFLRRAINKSRYLQELYEDAGTAIVPCYEVRYTLTIADVDAP